MRRIALATALGTLAAATAAGSAMAQKAPKMYTPDLDAMNLENWTPSDYAGSWQADELVEEADVYGSGGEEIGEVEDIVIGKDEAVEAFIIEAGGFLEAGDTHFRVPWKDVTIVGYDRIEVPLSEDSIDEFDMTDRLEGKVTAPGRAWRVSELINDYAVLKDGEAFGYVEDVLIGEDGAVRAVMVRGTGAYGYRGPYAMPYYGYDFGWGPGMDRYFVGHGPAELEGVPVLPADGPEPYFGR